MSRHTKFSRGDQVRYEGKKCRVLKRRRVSGLAMFQTADRELYLVSLDGEEIGWVPENEVERAGEGGGS